MPDLRGLFLRGHGSQSHTQNNGTKVGVTSTLHESGELGQVQGDAERRIGAGWLSISFWDATGAAYIVSGSQARIEGNPSSFIHSTISFDSSRVTPTAAENRPVNVAVRYLIRARP